MKEIRQQFLTGERALFQGADLKIYDTIFDDGESPLKESHNIELRNSMFKWKYPLWYSDSISVKDCTWFDMARAGVWYTNHMVVEDCAIEAPKNFRRCEDLTLSHVSIPNAEETLWNCQDVVLNDVTAKGDYFAMNSKDFAYYDYYTSLARCRGALSRKKYAQCFNVLKHHKKEVKDEL